MFHEASDEDIKNPKNIKLNTTIEGIKKFSSISTRIFKINNFI